MRGPAALVTPPMFIQAPPKPIHPEIKEYNPPPEKGDASPFSIAMKDGSVRSAMAVWTVGESLDYVDGHGKAGQAPIDSVDREATKKLNPGKNVQAWLP